MSDKIRCLLLGTAVSTLLAMPMTVEAQQTNTIYGDGGLESNTVGFGNSAFGFQALHRNTTGRDNTAQGAYALSDNISGYLNLASGAYTLRRNTRGYANTAQGAYALLANTTGNNNTATGSNTLYTNTTGSHNTANGVEALNANTTGSHNIALGYQAGFNNRTGNNNIVIGNLGAATESRTIRLGKSGTQTKTFIAGISGATASKGVQVFVNTAGQLGTLISARRFKREIKDVGGVSDKLMQLRPVSFQYKDAAEDGTYPQQYGLIAEEVAKVYPELVQYDDEGKPFTVYYHLLTPLLLSELQKEHHRNNIQQEEMAQQRRENSAQEREIAILKSALQQQETQLAALQQTQQQLQVLLKVK
ncbi:tail fiber domain-containing protein [Candidatus Cyanaurora vandensis]|uniref:tail fiber domain-containing protein n=2 Tax=Candidatus Cyanaurora vandensis TaxID=2714958 RepID=UPI00257A2A6D|nr:tail fiber domain-containing protein [Candidatus Cyanaurora vandensis]